MPMKTLYLTLRKSFLITGLISFTSIVVGQPTGLNYSNTQPAGVLQYNSASLGQVDLITAPNTDDQLASFNASALTGWGGFYFGGVWYPQATTIFWVSS